MKNGVPFDVAFSLDDIERAGWAIAFSEMEGNKFDFNAMEWIKDHD